VYGALRSSQDAAGALFYIWSDAERPGASPHLRRLIDRVDKSGATVRCGWSAPQELSDPGDLATLRASTSDDEPLVVTGAAGSGKTAPLCTFGQALSGDPSIDLFEHYATATRSGTDPPALLRRLLHWLDRQFGTEIGADAPPMELRSRLEAAFGRVPPQRRVVIVIDRVDLLDDIPEARHFVWLPRQLPPCIHVIVSARDPATLAAAERRGWRCHRVEALAAARRRTIAGQYLRPYGKQLSGT
jgi:hypothetical protein